MPYTPPSLEVVQDLDASAVVTADPSQPIVVIGPGFQIVDDETAGTYTGGSLVVGYASAGVVDVREDDPLALASENHDIEITLEDVVVEFLSSTALGSSHVPSLTLSASANWSVNNSDTEFTYTAAEDADVALLAVGDFISFSGLPNVWFKIDGINTTTRRVSWLGGAWNFGALATQSISAVRPALPDATDPGATAWDDSTLDFSALSVAVGDDLVVTAPARFAGTKDITSVDTDVSKLNIDGSFTSATRDSLGTALLTNASTAVDSSAGTADFTAMKAAVDAGETVALYDSVSGAFIPVASVASATAATLAVNWPGTAPSTNTVGVSYMGPTTPVNFSIQRSRPDLALPRIDWDYLQVVVTASSITIPAGLTSGGFDIVSASVHTQYRALDESLKTLQSVANTTELAALFTAGTSALVPSNPLGYAASIALANTNNAVWVIGYDQTFYTSEAQAFAEVLELLQEQGVYTLLVCSMTGDTLAPALKVHVEDQSGQDKAYFRIGVFCRRQITQEDVVEDTTTGALSPDGVAASGLTLTHLGHATTFPADGVLVGHKVQIVEAVGPTITRGHVDPSTREFTDEENLFPGVNIGDDLVIEAGTDVGTYAVTQNASGVITVPATLTGDDVSAEEIEAAATAISAGALAPDVLDTFPMVAETLRITGDISLSAWETGVTGIAIAGTVAIALGPIKAGTAVVLDINGVAGAQQVTISAGDVFSVTGGAMTINAGNCTINRATGAISIDKTSATDNTTDDWTATYTGYIDATSDAAGNVTGVGISAGTLDEDTGVFTGLATVAAYSDAGGGTVTHATAMTADYRPRVAYHIVYKSAVSPLITTDHEISAVAADVLTFAASILGTVVGPLRSVEYRVVKDLTLDEQATAMAGVASSPSISSRRMVMVQPDTALAQVNNVETQVPGYVFGAALGGLIDELPSQQGLTRRGVAGVTGRVGGKDHFLTDARLNTVAGGGIMLFESDGVGQGVYIRHQLTSNVSALLYQELSFTKNIDSVSSEMKTALETLLGEWNVQEGLFIVIKTRLGAIITKNVQRRLPKIGGKLKPGSKVLSAAESATRADQVEVVVDGRFPAPLNSIILTVRAAT